MTDCKRLAPCRRLRAKQKSLRACAVAPEQMAVVEEKAPKVDLAKVPLPTSDESDALLRVRHSCAHIMAMAMQRVHRGTQVTIGPWIERGFYYDFDVSGVEKPFTDKVMKKVQKEMRRLIRKDLPFVRECVSAAEARQRIEAQGETYKLEILEDILQKCVPAAAPLECRRLRRPPEAGAPPGSGPHTSPVIWTYDVWCRDAQAEITIYHIGQPGDKEHWWDLCAGPHVESTGDINAQALHLERSAGAYWRGDENRAMLTRIYGTAWQTEEQLAAYHFMQEEAAKRDHRKLGAQLDLFSIQVCRCLTDR